MAAVRSARERDGRPILSGVGARYARRKARVTIDVLVITHKLPAGSVRLELHSDAGITRLSVFGEGLKPGRYANATLEVTRESR